MTAPTKTPAFVCIYARPKAGKTTDCGYSFPTALFLATPGALKPLATTCGYDPEARGQVRYIERLADAVKIMPEAKKAGHDAVVADDFSFLVEREWAALEKKFTGFTLFGKLREEVEAFRDAARYSGLHVIANCFSRDTEFVTADGVRSFADYAPGDEVTVLTHTGAWQRATVKSYGMRPMNRITIRRGPARHVVTATPDHRWLLADGTETTTLSVGDRLLPAPDLFGAFDFDSAADEEKRAWVRGFHYGDGTTDARGYANVRLCKQKSRFWTRFADLGFKTRTPDWSDGDVLVNLGKMPKTVPSAFATPAEARAYVAGYLAADGHINKSVRARSHNPFTGVQTSDPQMAAFIRKFFPVAGAYLVSETRVTRTTNYGTHDAAWFTTVEGFSAHPAGAFVVASIEVVAAEKAWCLEVDNDASFVLPFGVATGNCWEKPPGIKNGISVRGGPQLHGDLPEKFPALCDLVLRGGTDPMRPGPHKGVYLCSPNDDAYVMGDRHSIAPPIGPMNLAEILRLAGYDIRRLPEAGWQEPMVDAAAGLILDATTNPQEAAERQRTVLSRVVDRLSAQGIDGRLIAWTLRDILDRVALRRMHTARWSPQGVLTSFTGA